MNLRTKRQELIRRLYGKRLPTEAAGLIGPESGTGLRCLGHFSLADHLARYRTQAQAPEEALRLLLDELLQAAGRAPRRRDLRLETLLGRLPAPFGEDTPAWALSAPHEGHPSWPRLEPGQGLALLARTAGLHYLAARPVRCALQDWLASPRAWFLPETEEVD